MTPEHSPDLAATPPHDPTRAGGAELLRAIFDNAYGFIGVLSPEGRILEVNRRALDFAGKDRASVVGRFVWEGPWWPPGHPERDRLRAAVTRAQNAEFVRTDVELVGADGMKVDVDLTLVPVRDRAGTVQIIVGEGRDVTQTKRAERELRLSEARFSGIVSIASDAIVSADEAQRIVLFNRGAEQIFGWTAEQVIGEPLSMLMPHRYRTVHGEHMRRFAGTPIAARRMGERQEIVGLRRDGEEFPAEASISKIEVDGALLFTVLLRDATERRRVERAQRFLARAGQRLAASLDIETTLGAITELGTEFIADCCVIYDAGESGEVRHLELRHAQSRHRALMEELRNAPLDPREPHPALAVLDTGVAELIPDVSLAPVSTESPAARLFTGIGVRSAMLVPLVVRDRTIGVLAFYSGEAGRQYGIDDLSLARELANRAALALDNARLYREARQAIQARDDVLAVVSHDLGNPLSAIRIGTSLLLRNVPEEERGKGGWAHLEGIRNSAQQMERLVNDLLEIKRIEAGHLSLDRARHSADALVTETVELFQPLAGERGIALQGTASATGAAVRCDRTRLLQVFSNLIGNALKFTPEGGRVHVFVTVSAAEVQFTVADTGKGIAVDDLPHVFDRFWRAQRAKREGIGLGLAIAKGIVLAHGGRIWAESTQGEGSHFHFALPVDAGEVDTTEG